MNSRKRREDMVRHQIEARGVRDVKVLAAMRKVPREAFMPASMRELAYDDAPAPIPGGQTISQPYIVGLMIEALDLKGGERVLEIGAGCGYAAAVLGEVAGEVHTVETLPELARLAASNLADQGYSHVHVHHGDGTLGWPAAAPYDAIVVAAGAPAVPVALKQQLVIGGRLVIPVGDHPRGQELVRVTRVAEQTFTTEELADVRFVPLIGAGGWQDGAALAEAAPKSRLRRPAADPLPPLIEQLAEPFGDIDTAPVDPLLQRIGDARVVLLGEASHGTSEFYRMRAHITRSLIREGGVRCVAIEGDWPDAARIDHYVRHLDTPPGTWRAFARFPEWMWRNTETAEFVDWLREHNATLPFEHRVGFHGLDLYSLYTSVQAVLAYLDGVDPDTARVARARYACLTPWQGDPASYGHAALTGRYRSCEDEVARMLLDMLEKRQAFLVHDGDRYLDAVQNARLVAAAERYYRIMYYGSRESWNLRDSHMFDTLVHLLAYYGDDARAVVWAHNSHVGDARATEMSARGEHNIGQLCREHLDHRAYIVGFGTHDGTVAAASDWDGPMEIKNVRPSHSDSYERACHASGTDRFFLPLGGRTGGPLGRPRLERAIGVIYRPESELASHYIQAVLPAQFDEYIWFDRTSAVTPLAAEHLDAMPDTYPFGL